jgi:hypothetical protein
MSRLNLALPFLFRLPRYLRTPFLLSVLLSCLFSLVLLSSYFYLQPVVPLFYSLAQPNDYLVSKIWLATFPLLSFAITFGHIFLIRFLFEHQRIIPLLFAWFTVAVQLLFALAFFRIILITL